MNPQTTDRNEVICSLRPDLGSRNRFEVVPNVAGDLAGRRTGSASALIRQIPNPAKGDYSATLSTLDCMIVIKRIPVAETRELRHAILRPTRPFAESVYPGDDNPHAGAFGAYDEDGRLGGVVSVQPSPCPWLPDVATAWRLRGMAVLPEWRKDGVGSRLFDAALDHVAADGGTLIWCHARVAAQPFYQRHGFATEGEVFDYVDVPHVSMSRSVP